MTVVGIKFKHFLSVGSYMDNYYCQYTIKCSINDHCLNEIVLSESLKKCKSVVNLNVYDIAAGK